MGPFTASKAKKYASEVHPFLEGGGDRGNEKRLVSHMLHGN